MKKTTNVKGYTKRTKKGKVVNVKASKREYDAAEDIAKEAIKKAVGAGNELKKKKRLEELAQLSDDDLENMDDLTFDELQEIYNYRKNNKGAEKKKAQRDDDALLRFDDRGNVKDVTWYIDKDLMKKDLEKDKKRRVMKYENPSYQGLERPDSENFRSMGSWKEADSDEETPKSYAIHRAGQKGDSYYENDKHLGDFDSHSNWQKFRKERHQSLLGRLLEKTKQVKEFLREIGKSEVPHPQVHKETPAERSKRIVQETYEDGVKKGWYKKNRKGGYDLTSKGYEEILRRRMERNKRK